MAGSRVISQLWQRLAKLREVSLNASNGPGSDTDWRGHGRGSVEVRAVDSAEANVSAIIQVDQLSFQNAAGQKLSLQNVYQWSLLENGLCLQNLQGSLPAFSLELVPVTEQGFAGQLNAGSEKENYQVQLLMHADQLEIIWRLRGPGRNECLHYHYW